MGPGGGRDGGRTDRHRRIRRDGPHGRVAPRWPTPRDPIKMLQCVRWAKSRRYANALKALVTRETLRLVHGQKPGPASSVAKVALSVLIRRAATATLSNTSRAAMVQSSDPEVFAPYFGLPSELIGGGTIEIQLTVIAQMILGLPRK